MGSKVSPNMELQKQITTLQELAKHIMEGAHITVFVYFSGQLSWVMVGW